MKKRRWLFVDNKRKEDIAKAVLQQIFRASDSGQVLLMVSRQTLYELEVKKDRAWQLAKTLTELPNWPIGSWDEQVCTWEEQTGTWDEAKRNHQIQLAIKALAKSGTDIRDRGGYIDALCSGADGFVTSDRQLIAPGPSERINERFSTKVVTPEQLVKEMGV
jgi:hypothetical protein